MVTLVLHAQSVPTRQRVAAPEAFWRNSREQARPRPTPQSIKSVSAFKPANDTVPGKRSFQNAPQRSDFDPSRISHAARVLQTIVDTIRSRGWQGRGRGTLST